ncbi:MAG: GxxExxY protein [Xanthomonadales bacterium]|nr:GxxExxY protein [Xanthomonadales bacterium]
MTGLVVDRAMRIHQDLGPGLLETVYEAILEKKLSRAGLRVRRQVPVPLKYDGLEFKESFRADLIVEDRVVVEIKAVEEVLKAHKRQLLTYLKLTNLQVGLLLNFGVAMMRDGIARVVNDFHE